MEDGSGADPFQYGVFSCVDDCGTCCYALWCPCCALASMRREFDGMSSMGEFFFNAFCLTPIVARSAVRHKYNLEGSAIEDVILGSLCCWCTICQLNNETISRGRTTPPDQNNTWQVSLCHSMAISKICIFATCCPVCAAALARERYDGSSFCFNCMCTPPGVSRSIVRQGLGIKESSVACDCLAICFFFLPCWSSQLLLQVETGKPGLYGNEGGVAPEVMDRR